MTVIPNQDDHRLNPMGSQFLIPALWNLCSESVGSIKIWDQVKDSDTGGPSPIAVRLEHVLAFQYWYCAPCVENSWRRDRKHCFINSLALVESSVDEGWWGWTESLIYGQLKSRKFKAGILAEAISTTHSDMYQLHICTFYFYEPFLFQIFVSWHYLVYYKFYHIFPCFYSQ